LSRTRLEPWEIEIIENLDELYLAKPEPIPEGSP
jgi:hypothetical protein